MACVAQRPRTTQREPMRVLLIAGLSRPHKEIDYLKGTLFDRELPAGAVTLGHGDGARPLSLYDLGFQVDGAWVPLLRPYVDSVPHLTTATLESILAGHDVDCVTV